MDTMEHATRKKVREHPAALRQQVLNECAQPGASVAKVAQVHGLNANLVHAWRK
jgi:transposase